MGLRAGTAIAAGLVVGLFGLYACSDYDDATPVEDAGTEAAANNVDSGPIGADDGGEMLADADAGASNPDGSFCGQHVGATFCWDFSSTEPAPTFGWSTALQAPAGATLEVEGTGSDRHLHARAVAAPSGMTVGAELVWDFGLGLLANGQTIKLEFDFSIASANTYAVLGSIQFGTGQDRLEYGLAVNAGPSVGSIVASENDRTDKPIAGGKATLVPGNSLHHGMVTLTRTGAQVGGSVSVDAMGVNARSSGAMPDALYGPIRILVGAAFSGSNGTATDVTIDNVLVTMP